MPKILASFYENHNSPKTLISEGFHESFKGPDSGQQKEPRGYTTVCLDAERKNNMANENYLRFLSLLMFNRVYDSQTINLYFEDPQKASYYRQKALKNGHIKKITFTKRERTKHKTDLYSLTKKGLRYFTEHDTIITPQLTMYEASNYLNVLKRGDLKPERQEKIARDTAAITLASKAGISIPVDNYTNSLREISSEEQEDTNASLSDFFQSSLTDELYQSFGLYENASPDSPMTFHNSSCVKLSAGNANTYVTSRDYLAGRYSGVIDSHLKSILIYAAPMFGMKWSKWIVEKERNAYRLWKTSHGVAGTHNSEAVKSDCAALIVDNPNQFSNLYRDVDKVQMGSEEIFGGPFKSFYILPLNMNGAKHLRWILMNNDDTMNAAITNDAIESGSYVRNDRANPGLFPLLNAYDQRTALGFQLDAKQMMKIERVALSIPSETFEVLCYDWQVPYFKSVMPENVVIEGMEAE